MSVTREDYVTRSVIEYLKDLLVEKGYDDDVIELLDEFPHGRFEGVLDKTYIAAGFNFDDTGKQAELGSTVKRRLYTTEFFIFGKNRTWGKNVAQAVKFCLENDQIIPLLDISDKALPQIDALPVIGVMAQHQAINQPAPWQENIWTVHCQIEDTYEAAEAVT
jgi:hypothetical protein